LFLFFSPHTFPLTLPLYIEAQEEGLLLGLPPEILFEVLLFCNPNDVHTLSFCCHTLNNFTRNEALWCSLFHRHYAWRYEGSGAATTWPHEDDLINAQTWPAVALEVCGVQQEEEDAPPCLPLNRKEYGHSMTLQVAFLLSLGVGWKWICIAHQLRIASSAPRPSKIRAPASLLSASKYNFEPGLESMVYVGQRKGGKRHGIGVQLYLTKDGKLDAWAGGRWHEDSLRFCMESTADRVVINYLDEDSNPKGLAFIHIRDAGSSHWGRVDNKFHLLPRAEVDPRMNIQQVFNQGVDVPWVEDLRSAYFDGTFACDDEGKRHGSAVIQFRNGDVALQRWRDDGLVGLDEFICAPTCPSAKFAGRHLGKGLSWTISWFPLTAGWSDNAYWPEGNSEDVRVFWEYVAEGFIGWREEARQHGLKELAKRQAGN